jgi:NAD(P)-dependent dehydrogenase (short-subunit alcohol dehydrogenase family)
MKQNKMENGKLNGKVAFVTGANRGLGPETARKFGKTGVRVVLGSRDSKEGEAAAAKLRNEGITAESLGFDVTRSQDHQKAYDYFAKKYGRLDILVNNAGVLKENQNFGNRFRSKPVSAVSPEILRETFAEAMALGKGLGLSQKMLFDSLLGTPAVAPFLASKREKIESGNYEAEFPLRWMQKDMHLASVSAYESGVAMPLTNAAKEIYRLAMREGHATQDFSAIYDYLTNNHDSATIGQKLTDSAKTQPHHAN